MSDTPYIITQTIALFSCILSPGFIAARLYRAGYNDRKTDIGLYTAFFNLFTVMSYVFLPASWPLMLVLAVSMILPFIVLWVLKRWDYRFFAFLRKLNITNSNNYGTVWQTLIGETKVRYSYVTLFLKDGSSVMCQTWHKDIRDTPLNSWIADKENSAIALHVTHSAKKEDKDFQECEEFKFGEQRRISWFPMQEIKRIELCYTKY